MSSFIFNLRFSLEYRTKVNQTKNFFIENNTEDAVHIVKLF